MIGYPLRRIEDPRLITGGGRYVDDLAQEGTLHAAFIRSVEAHGLVSRIEFSPAYTGPGQLFTAVDLGMENPMPVQNPSPLLTHPVQPPPLATSEVCYVGQPIAVVVAPSAVLAADAAQAVEVDYETLAVVMDHRTALDPNSPLAHEGAASNLATTLRAGYGDVDDALSSAPHTLIIDIDQHRGALASMEGRAIMARWEEAEARLTMWTSTQSPHAVRASVAGYLGISPDEMRVIAPDVGGGFGPKAMVYPEEYVLAKLALVLGHPVKWAEKRREHFTATAQQRGQSGRIEVGYDENGRLLGLRAHLAHDVGAYVPYGVAVPMTTLRLMSGPYVVPALAVTIDCVYTNATPTGAIRGAGRPNATFALERVMDAVARELNLDRAEVRRRNFIPHDSFPYPIQGLIGSDGRTLTYDGGDYAAALEAALRSADASNFADRRAASESAGKRRGMGIASYIEDTGTGPYEGARLEILTNSQVVVEVGASTQGQGLATVMAQIVAGQLGVDPGQVRVNGGDTARYGQGIGTVASRSAQTSAAAVHVAAGELAKLVRQAAAHKLEAAVGDIVLGDGHAMVRGQPGTEISLGELASGFQAKFGGTLHPDQLRPGLSVENLLPFDGPAFTYGTHIAEVEVDPETGHVEVVGYVVVHDCGIILNPMIVDGQIDGGVAHGLGNALMEEIRYSESGQPLTTTFLDYRIMTASEMPKLTKIHMETPSPTNPLGAKGAGEGGTIPAAAAVVSAVEDALSDRGVVLNHYPIRSEWVFRALSTDRISREDLP